MKSEDGIGSDRVKTTSPLEDHRPPSRPPLPPCRTDIAATMALPFALLTISSMLVTMPASSSPSPPPISSLPPAIQRVAMVVAFTGPCCCCHRSCCLCSSLHRIPFLLLPWMPSSQCQRSTCFAGTGCCRGSSGSCDGASWVRAPGVPRPHSRGLLHLLDLLH